MGTYTAEPGEIGVLVESEFCTEEASAFVFLFDLHCGELCAAPGWCTTPGAPLPAWVLIWKPLRPEEIRKFRRRLGAEQRGPSARFPSSLLHLEFLPCGRKTQKVATACASVTASGFLLCPPRPPSASRLACS